jgi:hypothetical protein
MNGDDCSVSKVMQRDDLKKQAKVVDMMLTMHSILANRYHRRGQVLELSLLAVSTVLVALTFIDPQVLTYFNVSQETSRILIGICSILVFFLSVVSLIVDWKGKARQHREAFNTLVPHKSEWSEMIRSFDEYDSRARAEFVRESSLIIGNLTPIPDARFNSLKARHHQKVMLSKMISRHPGSSVAMLRFLLWWRLNRRAFKSSSLEEGQ